MPQLIRNTFDRPERHRLRWENQSVLISGYVRYLALMVAGFLACLPLLGAAIGEGAVPPLGVAAALATIVCFLLWFAWMRVPIRSLEIGPSDGSFSITLRRRTEVVPLEQVYGVQMWTGKIAILTSSRRFRFIPGRRYTFVVYDAELRSFIAACRQWGIPTVSIIGVRVPDDIDMPL